MRWELMDVGVLSHPGHGRGVVMRVGAVPDEGLLDDPDLPDRLAAVCDHFAPSVIPHVREQTGLDAPDFVAVRLTSGGAVFGRYVLRAFEVSDEGCGDPF